MLRTAGAVLIAAAILSLAGCNDRSRLMTSASPPESPRLEAGKATVVFYRSSEEGDRAQAVVFDVTTSPPVFIGVVSAGAKVAYSAPPGERRFMVTSEEADFMDAQLAPGKTYDVEVAPHKGVWRARFSLEPRAADALQTQQQVALCTWYAVTPRSRQWAQEHQRKFDALQKRYLPRWLAQEQEKPMLHASDGG